MVSLSARIRSKVSAGSWLRIADVPSRIGDYVALRQSPSSGIKGYLLTRMFVVTATEQALPP
ncbi:MAG: hypothetical protein D4S02_15640 [Rhodocyclaceae bacterium]|nr:MAG: hypothetical protein D4S02_15640 [Rhodocyclaceae bacterium]